MNLLPSENINFIHHYSTINHFSMSESSVSLLPVLPSSLLTSFGESLQSSISHELNLMQEEAFIADESRDNMFKQVCSVCMCIIHVCKCKLSLDLAHFFPIIGSLNLDKFFLSFLSHFFSLTQIISIYISPHLSFFPCLNFRQDRYLRMQHKFSFLYVLAS